MSTASRTKHISENPPRVRLVSRGEDDRLQIIRTGHSIHRWDDLYAKLIAAKWREVFALIIIIYLTINVCFAILYLSLDGTIENARPGSFADVFFFSVQTLSTIGYGKMSPVGLLANMVVTVEVITGFTFFALVTGLMFSKFSRPTARVLFSNVAVISRYNGAPYFMLRLANERNNRIVNANVHVVILKKETTQEGRSLRRFHDMNLVRSTMPVLQLTWTLLHPIDEQSPLYGITDELLKEWDAEIIVSLTGIDETTSQTIHARYSYIDQEILCGFTFVDIIEQSKEGTRTSVNYHLFHDTKPLTSTG